MAAWVIFFKFRYRPRGQMSTQNIFLLVRANRVASHSRHTGGLHAGRPAANDHNFLLFHCRGDGIMQFSSYGRVHCTAHGFAVEQPAGAGIVASETRTDRIRLTGLDLVAPLRVRQQTATDGHQVRLSISNHGSGYCWIVHAAHGDNGNIHSLLGHAARCRRPRLF